jgi:cation-transporting ATPase I
MIAEGTAGSADDPRDLVALGFLGIADPLRATVPAAVQRCHEAGVRVVMLTGDHPATARAIARAAGLPADGDAVLTGADIARLGDDELSARLDRASVVARITPLDKVRIVDALQGAGHAVAMTGDGVNDAPALRLADVGVAMGRTGTEVARESSDVVLTDDDFSTLVEVLVEGRGFWANMRRSLAVLLGGNLGELGLMVGAIVAGLASPLTARQVLTVNLVTDVLPAVALAVQEPEHRDLRRHAREGAAGLDAPLRNDIVGRALATAGPSLAAYIAANRLVGPRAAQSVAFGSVVATQLAHTADLGRIEGRLSGQVVGAIAASAAVTAAALFAPGVHAFLGLAPPGPLGLGLVAAATAGALLMARALVLVRVDGRAPVGATPAAVTAVA